MLLIILTAPKSWDLFLGAKDHLFFPLIHPYFSLKSCFTHRQTLVFCCCLIATTASLFFLLALLWSQQQFCTDRSYLNIVYICLKVHKYWITKCHLPFWCFSALVSFLNLLVSSINIFGSRSISTKARRWTEIVGNMNHKSLSLHAERRSGSSLHVHLQKTDWTQEDFAMVRRDYNQVGLE